MYGNSLIIITFPCNLLVMIYPIFFQHPTAAIGDGCKIGPCVVIGPDVVVEDGVCLSNCTILQGTKIKSHAWIKQAIIGWNCTIGRWVRIFFYFLNNVVIVVISDIYSLG